MYYISPYTIDNCGENDFFIKLFRENQSCDRVKIDLKTKAKQVKFIQKEIIENNPKGWREGTNFFGMKELRRANYSPNESIEEAPSKTFDLFLTNLLIYNQNTKLS